ncbi:MAG: hypothetical protein JXA24_04935 [Proteobacteria bacterium]|nr:hypothetical protein [Pseudomonadota bacterium]
MIKVRQIVFIFSFGAAWGLIEAILGGALHVVRVPYAGLIMSGIGFSILFMALKSGVGPMHLFAVSLVAAAFKFLSAPIYSIPAMQRCIWNPAISIAMQGLAFSAVARFGLFSAARRAASALLSDKAAR